MADSREILEMVKAGKMSSAKEMIHASLDEIKERVQTQIKENIVKGLFESRASVRTPIGEIEVDNGKREIRLKGVGTFENAMKVAAKFAAFCDNADPKKYTAKDSGGDAITIYSSGKPYFDLYFQNGELVMDADVENDEMEFFKKNKKFPARS